MAQSQLNKTNLKVSHILENDSYNDIDITRKKHNKYTVVKYDKEKCLPSSYHNVGFLRCMIIDRDENRIVCVGPNKSIMLKEFDDYYNGKLHYEEFVDGVMINVFWDATDEKWEYATRSNVGASIRFFVQDKTFRTMFEEALLEDNIDLNILSKSLCYSFVLQHPLNRIVSPVERPRAVLVEAHEITDEIATYYPHGMTDNDLKLRSIIDKHSIPIPEKYKYKNHKEAKDAHATRNTYFGCVGVIIKNYETGCRSKIRNPVYEEVKSLRGNHPKLQYLYLVLRQSGSVSKYLHYFNENAGDFETYRTQLHNYSHNLYVNYVDCFINKKARIHTYPHQYKVSMSALHTIYLDTLMPNGNHIHKGVVIKYVNELPPQRQMYLINYNFRK